MIDDLQSMSKVRTLKRRKMIEIPDTLIQYVLEMYMKYRTKVERKPGTGAPTRIIFYRDGVR
jgi:eukaryotic translation initiation factor 2C